MQLVPLLTVQIVEQVHDSNPNSLTDLSVQETVCEFDIVQFVFHLLRHGLVCLSIVTASPDHLPFFVCHIVPEGSLVIWIYTWHRFHAGSPRRSHLLTEIHLVVGLQVSRLGT